jgi:hypothetical protein
MEKRSEGGKRNMINIQKPRAGFYVTAAALVLSIVGFVLYFKAFEALGYNDDRWVIALTVIAFWSMAFLTVNALFAGDSPFWSCVFYVIIVFALLIALAKFLSACLSPIGIYFTVNMGDMAAYAQGVPRCIAGVACYAVAAICIVVASFMKPTRDRGAKE